MNKYEAAGFQKEAAMLPLVRLRGAAKRFFARRRGAIDQYRQVNREAAELLKTNPNADVKGFRKTRSAQLAQEGAETAQQKAIDFQSQGAKGRGFLAKHKGKLLLGAAGLGGVAYATSGKNPEEEQRKKQIEAIQRMRVPNQSFQ